jgi:hypothetical protein
MHRRRRFVDAVEQAAAQHCKNEILWLGSVRRQHQIPDDLLPVGLNLVVPVRDLGIHLDSDLSMRTHVRHSDCVQLFRGSETDP